MFFLHVPHILHHPSPLPVIQYPTFTEHCVSQRTKAATWIQVCALLPGGQCQQGDASTWTHPDDPPQSPASLCSGELGEIAIFPARRPEEFPRAKLLLMASQTHRPGLPGVPEAPSKREARCASPTGNSLQAQSC